MTIETEPRLIEMNFGIYDGEPIETTAFQENRSEISLPFPEGISPRCRGSNLSLIEEALASEETYFLFATMRLCESLITTSMVKNPRFLGLSL